MLFLATTPFSALLGLFFVVPVGILCSIYCTECAAMLRIRHGRRAERPAAPVDAHH